MPAALDGEGELLLPEGIVPFPRGFGFGRDGRAYLASGVAPSGDGDNTIVVFDRSGRLHTPRLVTDPELSAFDLKVASNGTSWWPANGPSAPLMPRPAYANTTRPPDNPCASSRPNPGSDSVGRGD